jgi:ADP-ribose pyrophosphatase YjhB (NUDIX family)
MIQYNFCPKCGNKFTSSSEPPVCVVCDITYYRNAKPCASVLPIKDGKVLLARRGREPFKGSLDVIGGFMEADEHPEAAAIREAKEETGLDIVIDSLLGIYVDRYGAGGNYTLNLHYLGSVTGGKMEPMDDVVGLGWVPIADVPLDEGFENTKAALRDLRHLYEKT